jgi:hypothetical protein
VEALARLLAEFVDEKGKLLDETYVWKVPTRWPDCGFERGTDSLAAANIRLRRALSAAWHERPADRASIEKWYVAAWGGVRANREKTLAAYAASSDEELLGRGIAGVASWSKILVVRRPERFAIYDARVGAALNALQIARGSQLPLLFPRVPSRNKIIGKYQANEASMAHAASRVPKQRAYRAYLDLISSVAKNLNFANLDRVEMALFANAEQLARDALSRNPASRQGAGR